MIITKQSQTFLNKNLAFHESEELLDVMRKIQEIGLQDYGGDTSFVVKGKRYTFGEEIVNLPYSDLISFCKKNGLTPPARLKYNELYKFDLLGGIRVIFAFTEDEEKYDEIEELYILKIDFRENEPYGKGR